MNLKTSLQKFWHAILFFQSTDDSKLFFREKSNYVPLGFLFSKILSTSRVFVSSRYFSVFSFTNKYKVLNWILAWCVYL